MTDPGKADRVTVNYRPGHPNQRCGVCMNYRVPNTCRRVAGMVEPSDVCDLFNRDILTAGEE